MRHRSGWRIALILAIVLVSGIFLYRTPFNLGLDLKGGVHVVLEADSSAGEVTSENMSGVVSINERRINALGVSEPLIQRQDPAALSWSSLAFTISSSY